MPIQAVPSPTPWTSSALPNFFPSLGRPAPEYHWLASQILPTWSNGPVCPPCPDRACTVNSSSAVGAARPQLCDKPCYFNRKCCSPSRTRKSDTTLSCSSRMFCTWPHLFSPSRRLDKALHALQSVRKNSALRCRALSRALSTRFELPQKVQRTRDAGHRYTRLVPRHLGSRLLCLGGAFLYAHVSPRTAAADV